MIKTLSNLVIPAPVKLAFKLTPYIAIALLAGALFLTRSTLSETKGELGLEVEFREMVGRHIACPQLDRSSMASCLSALIHTNENRGKALERISEEALAAKRRADAADAELARQQAEHQRRFAAAQRRITDLESRRSTGDAAADAAQIEEDSKAAWEGWR